jgi:hypothetical protein
MAVELCKVGLWMEAVEPGLPLTFLNSHIQHGNALAQASGIFGNNLMNLGGLGVALMTGNPGMSLGFGGSLGQKGGSNYYGG